jgi:hypothetical protein
MVTNASPGGPLFSEKEVVTEPPCGAIMTGLENTSGGFVISDPTTDEASTVEYQISLRLTAEAMSTLRRAQDLLGTKDLASTIEALATAHNRRKDPLYANQGRQSKRSMTSKKSKPVRPSSGQKNHRRHKEITPPSEQATQAVAGSAAVAPVSADQAETKARQPMIRSRYIPASVRRRVYQMSGGQCCYVNAANGHRCAERRYLEVDHIKPYALGGQHDVENLQILCRAHNMMRARETYGRDVV